MADIFPTIIEHNVLTCHTTCTYDSTNYQSLQHEPLAMKRIPSHEVITMFQNASGRIVSQAS